MSLAAELDVAVGDFTLGASLTVEPGETVAVLGPNGSGKTTLLRSLAGLTPLRAGRVQLDDEVLEEPAAGRRVPADQRQVGVVFQDHVLFPHLNVRENVAFGLRSRGMRRPAARREADRWLERLGLATLAGRRPAALSGGQAQQVALARALAIRPRLLLLDEPLAALDAVVKVGVRRELRRELAAFGGARLLVTHDPLEATLLADRLVILEHGRITQQGTATAVRARPRSAYVAHLVGVNLLHGRADGDHVILDQGLSLSVPEAGRGPVAVVIHPRSVALHRQAPVGSPRNVWRCRVESLDDEGERVRIRLSGPVDLVAEVTPAAVVDLALGDGGEVWAAVKATEITTWPA